DNELFGRKIERADSRNRPPGGFRHRGHDRRDDREARAAADSGREFDRMTEQATQAIDDGKAEAKPATKPSPLMLPIVDPVELAEYLLALVIRNAGPRVPDFDAQIPAALASADQHTAARGVP